MAAELTFTFIDPETLLLAGELDTHTAQQLSDELATVPAGTDLVLDLSSLTFIASAGLSAVLNAQRRLEESTGSLRVQSATPAVARLIELSGLSETLGLT